MNYRMNKIIDDLTNEYAKYFETYSLFSNLKDDYEMVKNDVDKDYKELKKQRDTEKFNLLKIHTSLTEKRNKMIKIYNSLTKEERVYYNEEFEELYNKYLDLKRGAIKYRKNITIPNYIKRNIQRYNIKF